jgi:hypothetical protein
MQETSWGYFGVDGRIILKLPPAIESPVPIGHEAGWAPEPVSYFVEKRKNFYRCQESNFGPSMVFTVLTEMNE